MRVRLVNPSDNSFGTAVITPRWLFVLAAATPQVAGDPILIDESLEQIDAESIQPGGIVGISVHTGKRPARLSGRQDRPQPWRVDGLRRDSRNSLPRRSSGTRRSAHRSQRDGDVAWGKMVHDCLAGKPERSTPSSRTGTTPAKPWPSNSGPSSNTASTSSARSSSACPPTSRPPSTPPWKWP